MSQALYRRYRPETFADVIGQEHVTEPLMQALRTGRVGHAYLFSGPRGCGKTTSARILARCLNCDQGPTPTPCGQCDSCVALARGGPGTVDVIEIDAASHGGVDDARDLRERASFGPAQSRYKIYIIDEAHMVTTQGFNALLKIVEEPPEHVKFVFATTEPEKVIGTIRSRTHHYPFRLVPPGQLTDYLERVCTSEGVSVEPGVLSFVTRAGGGSVRDSLSVLDQLIAGSAEAGLTYEQAASILGFTDAELLDSAVDAFGAGDPAAAFRAVERVVDTGLDPRRFVEDLLERFRDLIIVQAVPDGAAAVLRGVPVDQLERMRAQSVAFGPGMLSRAADVVNAGLAEMTGATSPRLQLELIAARLLLPGAAGEGGYAARLDRLERRLDVQGVPANPPRPRAQPGPLTPSLETVVEVVADTPAADPALAAAAAAAAASESAAATASVSVSTAGPESASESESEPPAGPRGLDTAALRRSWPDVLAKIFATKRATWTLVSEHAQVHFFDGQRLVLAMATGGLAQAFRNGPHAEYVRQALIDVLGADVRVEVVDADGAGAAAAAGPRPVGVAPPPRSATSLTPPPLGSPSATPSAGGSPSPTRPAGTGPADELTGPRAIVVAAYPASDADKAARAVEPAERSTLPGPGLAADPEPHVVDDSAASRDDEDIAEFAEVGVPVVERILGATVIRDELT